MVDILRQLQQLGAGATIAILLTYIVMRYGLKFQRNGSAAHVGELDTVVWEAKLGFIFEQKIAPIMSVQTTILAGIAETLRRISEKQIEMHADMRAHEDRQ